MMNQLLLHPKSSEMGTGPVMRQDPPRTLCAFDLLPCAGWVGRSKPHCLATLTCWCPFAVFGKYPNKGFAVLTSFAMTFNKPKKVHKFSSAF